MFLPPLNELAVYKAADNATKAEMDQCFQVTQGVDLARRAELKCPAYGYALMANFYNGAIGKLNVSC